MTPAEVAAEALRTDVRAVTQVEPIKHGLTNDSWLVRTGNDAVIVRLSNPAIESLRIDRKSEEAVLNCVAAAGIAPRVLLNDPDRRMLVTWYVGEPWSLEDVRTDSNVRRLAARLTQLHSLPIPTGVRTVDLADTVEGYLSTLDQHGARTALTTPEQRRHAHWLTEELRARSVPCLCHNDVHHLNVVGQREPLLIDWEYAGRGDPAFDLASVCVYHGYDARLRGLLLDGYATRGQAVDAERLEQACRVFEYVRDLWMAVRELTR